jgi:hypothetical protein
MGTTPSNVAFVLSIGFVIAGFPSPPSPLTIE